MSSIIQSRRDSDNIAAVNEARREIEKIKTELETLITSNIKNQPLFETNVNSVPSEMENFLTTTSTACNNKLSSSQNNECNKNNPLKTTPVILTAHVSLSPVRKKVIPTNPEEIPIEPLRPKSRTYDPEKTREFIKKQKLRRKEKLQEEEQKKKESEEQRKQKLQDLKRKTIELVAKNVKKSSNKSAKQSDDLNKSNTQLVDNKPPINKFMLQSKRCRARSFDPVIRDISVGKESTTKRSKSAYRENNKTNKQTIKQNSSVAAAKSQESLQSNSQKSFTPLKKPVTKILVTSNESKTENIINTNMENNRKTSLEENMNAAIIIDKPSNDVEIIIEKEKDPAKELTEIKQKLETSITQIKDKNETPFWLQPPTSIPYPYNFISAVRKKLEFVTRKHPTNETKQTDNNKLNVSIQCSIDHEKIFDINSVNISKLISPDKIESIKNTKTYDSHKCRRQLYPNLDIPQKHEKEPTINIKKIETDSDSDTTKNIPEIPHEEAILIIPSLTDHVCIKNLIRPEDTKYMDKSPLHISDRLKNITFNRNIPPKSIPKLNIGDIKLPEPKKYTDLIPPEDKIETSKQSRKNRSKYPEDIDSILSHYSKIKSEQNSSYSDDFNSVSVSKSESITEYKQIPSGFVSLSKSALTISEHLSSSSSKENIPENDKSNIIQEETKKSSSILSEKTSVNNQSTQKSIPNDRSVVSTETASKNLTMQDVPSLSKQSETMTDVASIPTTIKSVDKTESIKTDASTISSFNLKLKCSEAATSDEAVETAPPALKKPDIKLIKPNININVSKRRSEEFENNPNHIHLKLQAEVHLLNSFNNSLKQVVAVEKSLFDVPSTSTTHFNPINLNRGCDVVPEHDDFLINSNNNRNGTSFKDDDEDDSICSQDLGMSNVVDRSSISTSLATNSVISKQEDRLDIKHNPYVAISLDMVDQMIKDEDIRLEHLKAVLKLRDQALFDRIKGELALLEIRKRELREHGLTNDITAIKKKQRGLIIKLQQERHEMHRLKTAHKQASKARKTALHEQKSIIKTQLSSTDQIPKKLRRLSHVERPSLGPVKVYRVDSRTEFSETTLSRKGSDDSITIATNSSVVTQISEKFSVEKSEIHYSDNLAVESVKSKQQSSHQSEKLKRSLLMKEAEIDKRRKEIEELIKWQKRLKQKEAEVAELERQAVKSLQSDDQEKVRVFTGAHLNKVWKGIALPDKNFDEQKKYQMSKRSLDKFYQNARKMFKEVSEEERNAKTESYSSEFEQTHSTTRLDLSNSVASLNEVEVQTKLVADRLRQISNIISVPEDDDRRSSNVSSIHSSLLSKDDKSTSSEIEENDSIDNLSDSKSQSVKTEVNTLIKSDLTEPSKFESDSLSDSLVVATTPSLEIHNHTSPNSVLKSIVSDQKLEPITSEFTDSLQNIEKKSDASETIQSNIDSLNQQSERNTSKSLELIIASEISLRKSDDIIPKSLNLNILIENTSNESDVLSEKSHDSLNSSEQKSPSKSLEINIVSENLTAKSENKLSSSSISELEQEPLEKSTSQVEEIKSEELEKIESNSWEPQIISEVKADSQNESESEKIITENEFDIKSKQTSEPKNLDSEIKSDHEKTNTQSLIDSKIYDESSEKPSEIHPETKTQTKTTNSDTHISEQNLPTDFTTTPRSEFQYETDFDRLSESDQSKIETEFNVSLKETNVDSSNNDQSIESEHDVISSDKTLDEISVHSEKNKSDLQVLENKSIEESDSKIQLELTVDESKNESVEISNIEATENVESDGSKIISDDSKVLSSNQIVSDDDTSEKDSITIKLSPKDSSKPSLETIKVSEKSKDDSTSENSVASDISEHFDKSESLEKSDESVESHDENEIQHVDLNDSKKGVSHIDVRKRVSEILADANGPRGDKSPRVQDLYTTTYDIAGSSESTPESGSPTNEFSKQEKTAFSPETPYINEAEELLRKQLEIEQEIKRLERQQQTIPYLFMREIPNKPPPPYKPPDFPLAPVIASIIPSKPEQTKKIIHEANDILFAAYTTGDLSNTSSQCVKDDQQKFMFDLCKEIAIEACKPTIDANVPSWRSQKNKFQNLFAKRQITKNSLHSVLNRKVLQLLNFEPVVRNDSLIIRWSRKKRDHVDEILVSETQAEEAEWTNFDSDEEIIKDNLTQNILDLLIVDAAKSIDDILRKKKAFSWADC